MKRLPVAFETQRFLLVESHAFSRNLVKTMLSRAGARDIALATCVEEAIQILQQSRDPPFNCIISDWYLAPVSGLEFLQRVRANQIAGVEPDICFVLLTGFADAALVNLAIALDVNAYVLKPISTRKLMNSIAAGFSRRWRLQSPKYYRAIEGLGIPSEFVDPTQKNTFGRVRIIDPIGVHEANPNLLPFQNGQTVHLKQSQRVYGTGSDDCEIPNLCLSLTEEMQPGDILGQHIHDANGNLLLSRGTVLSETALGRIQDLAIESGEDVKLWIGRCAQ